VRAVGHDDRGGTAAGGSGGVGVVSSSGGTLRKMCNRFAVLMLFSLKIANS